MTEFSEKKATALAGYLLQVSGVNAVTLIKAMKLMYFCERHVYAMEHRFITNDNFVSLDNGPILSKTLDIMRGRKRGDIWNTHFKERAAPQHYIVDLHTPTDPEDLTLLEQETAEYFSTAFMSMDDFKIAMFSHEMCSEWKDPHGGSIPITPSDIQKALEQENNHAI